MRIMLARETGNLGDMLQAVALSRLIGEADGFYRDHHHLNGPQGDDGVAAGFMLGPTGWDPSKVFFCGIYWLATQDNLKWLRRSPFPVGARDRETYAGLRRGGIQTELVGCATLTLPRYEGPRAGVISVDLDGPGVQMTHKVPKAASAQEEWQMCLDRIERYRTAQEVHTSRLHVALPCLALGTPVRYRGPQEGRTTILDAIGLKRDTLDLPDVSPWRKRYIEFLGKHLRINLHDGGPIIPRLPGVPRG